MEPLSAMTLLRGDLLEVARIDMSGWLDWAGPFAVVSFDGHAVVVRDEREGSGGVEHRASYAQIRRRFIGCALPAWLERERGGRSFRAGDRVLTPRGAGAVVYGRVQHLGERRGMAAYSVKLDGVDHAGVIYPPELVSAEACS